MHPKLISGLSPPKLKSLEFSHTQLTRGSADRSVEARWGEVALEPARKHPKWRDGTKLSLSQHAFR